MKKAINITVIVLLLFASSCMNPEQGKAGVSGSISEAKERNIFLKQYHLMNLKKLSPFADNIKIKEAWLEKNWVKGNYRSETVIKDGTQFVVNFDMQLPDEIEDSLRVTINSVKRFSEVPIGRSRIHVDFWKDEIVPDTLVLFLYQLKYKNTKVPIVSFTIK